MPAGTSFPAVGYLYFNRIFKDGEICQVNKTKGESISQKD